MTIHHRQGGTADGITPTSRSRGEARREACSFALVVLAILAIAMMGWFVVVR